MGHRFYGKDGCLHTCNGNCIPHFTLKYFFFLFSVTQALKLIFYYFIPKDILPDYAGTETQTSAQGFKQVHQDYGVHHLGQGWSEASSITCAVKSMNMYANTGSFMYNLETKLCTPGGNLTKRELPPSSAEGNVYIMMKAIPSFNVKSYGKETSCIGDFNYKKKKKTDYRSAKAICDSMGFFYGFSEKLRQTDDC